MTDTPSDPPADEAVSRRMSRQRRRDTDPETALRRALHARGHRFRVDAPLPTIPRRRADILFSRKQVVVFIDGCFWHACPVHGTSPARNGAWWSEKLARNVARDRDTDARLDAMGWTSLRVWEHEKVEDAVARVEAALRLRDLPEPGSAAAQD